MRRNTLLMASLCLTLGAQAQTELQPQKWPDLPLLNIVTTDNVPLENNIITAPEGCIGQTTDNDYVGASLVMTLKGDTLLNTGNYLPDESGIRIRIRGNSTGVNNPQHPYKLKLTKKADLISPHYPVAPDKEWVLLNATNCHKDFTNEHTSILAWVGRSIGRILQMDYVPRTNFVNVVINGKYEGLYTLSENVKRSGNRIDIHKSGFILENDLFWWSCDRTFQTEHLPPFMGYSLKYPDDDEITDKQFLAIEQYIKDFEKALFENGDIKRFIDLTSFARWILSHDIIGSFDAGGTNMFISKDRFSAENPFEGDLMKMCVLWDFDSAFRCEPDQFASCHNQNVFYFQKLFEYPEFCKIYRELYQAIRPKLVEAFENEMQQIIDTYSTAYEESMAMHKLVFKDEGCAPLANQAEEAVGLLQKRLTFLDEMIPKLTAVDNVEMGNDNRPVAVYDLNGLRHSINKLPQLPRGVYLIRYANGQVVRKLAGE